MKWNIYEEINGLWEIVDTIESDTKPTVRRGQITHRAPTQRIDLGEYRPELAFPGAYGIGIPDKMIVECITLVQRD